MSCRPSVSCCWTVCSQLNLRVVRCRQSFLVDNYIPSTRKRIFKLHQKQNSCAYIRRTSITKVTKARIWIDKAVRNVCRVTVCKTRFSVRLHFGFLSLFTTFMLLIYFTTRPDRRSTEAIRVVHKRRRLYFLGERVASSI